ncbi:MAG: hypothetical protein OXI87_17480 [Albidovulum sp.]|nr:hypothetical protein [Albidovulum sp.]
MGRPRGPRPGGWPRPPPREAGEAMGSVGGMKCRMTGVFFERGRASPLVGILSAPRL